jgi:hypothetical protein
MRTQHSQKEFKSMARACPTPAGARCLVKIDGKPYAAFIDRGCAEQAVKLWLGEIDGMGLPTRVPVGKGASWEGIRGRKVEIVEL